MATLVNCATLVLHALTVHECNELSLVNSNIFSGPATDKLSRTVYNKLVPKKHPGLGIRDFIERLCVINANLHYFHLDDLNITCLALKWTYPNVRASTTPKALRLDLLAPNLRTLEVAEEGPADHCLAVFVGLCLPHRIKLLDFTGIHASDKDFGHILSVAKHKKARFCSCCEFILVTVWEDDWSTFPCSLRQKKDEDSQEY